MEPAKLARLVRGELDWIAMKALEKDRNRRYQTANDLARDLERYLAGEPVEAGRADSRLPAAQVCAEAPRRPWRRRRRWRRCWWRARPSAPGKPIRATRAESRATQAVAESKVVLEFFEDKVLAAARPRGQGGLGSEVTLRAALDAAESSIAAGFAARPKLEATIREALGKTYWALGDFAFAARQYELAVARLRPELSPDHPDTLTAMDNLAVAYRRGGRSREAIPILEKVLAARQKTLGPEHRDTLRVMGDLAVAYMDSERLAEAVSLLERRSPSPPRRWGRITPGRSWR